MQRILRYIGFFAIAGTVAIVLAQSSPRSKSGGGTASGGQVVASQGVPFSNSVLILMSQYFSFVQTTEISKAEENGRSELIDPIIRANCTANLWLQTPAQQADTIRSWEIEKYRGADPNWAIVAKTPSLVKELLNVNPQIDQKASELIDIVWKPIMDQDRDFNEWFAQTDAYKRARAESQDAVNKLHYVEYRKYRETHPLPPLKERRAATLARYEKAMQDCLAMLSKPQAAEFKMLDEKFEHSMRAATEGRTR